MHCSGWLLKDLLVQHGFGETLLFFFANRAEATSGMRSWQQELVISVLRHPKILQCLF